MIAADLGVSVAAAGTLVGAFALGLAVGGPLLTALTIRVDRRHVLVGSWSSSRSSSSAPPWSPTSAGTSSPGCGAGALQGVFLAAAFTTATAVVPPARSGRAVSVVIAGFALSTLVGLPLGAILGSALGWRGALLAVGGSALCRRPRGAGRGAAASGEWPDADGPAAGGSVPAGPGHARD